MRAPAVASPLVNQPIGLINNARSADRRILRGSRRGIGSRLSFPFPLVPLSRYRCSRCPEIAAGSHSPIELSLPNSPPRYAVRFIYRNPKRGFADDFKPLHSMSSVTRRQFLSEEFLCRVPLHILSRANR